MAKKPKTLSRKLACRQEKIITVAAFTKLKLQTKLL